MQEKHNSSFQAIKAEFCKKIIILFLSFSEPTFLQMDVSKKDFGQNGYSSPLCLKNPSFHREELSEFGKEIHGSSFGNEEMLSLLGWWRICSTNWPKATNFFL